MRKGKCAVIKTSTRQTVFLPLIGLVPAEKLTPGDLIGVNKDSYLVLDTLPAEFDNRVKAMEVDERPTETYTDIGGLEKQIEELVEAIVLPMEQADKFKTIGIKPPKGCLMYGPPGVCFSLPFWLLANNQQEPGKPFLRVHALPRRKHVT
jgi:26S proteasome regulatory subunit T5